MTMSETNQQNKHKTNYKSPKHQPMLALGRHTDRAELITTEKYISGRNKVPQGSIAICSFKQLASQGNEDLPQETRKNSFESMEGRYGE